MQTEDTLVSTDLDSYNTQTKDGRHKEHEVKNSNLDLLLAKPLQSGTVLISFLNVTPRHYW